MYLSCDTKKFHDNESTHILHNFWTSTHRRGSFPPFPLAAPLAIQRRGCIASCGKNSSTVVLVDHTCDVRRVMAAMFSDRNNALTQLRFLRFLVDLGPDLLNVLRQSYDYLTIMPKLRSTYDGRLIYKTSHEECNASLR